MFTFSPKVACDLCKVTGENGAQFWLLINGSLGGRVHKPCGELYKKRAPEGTDVDIIHNTNIARTLGREQEVRKFWIAKMKSTANK